MIPRRQPALRVLFLGAGVVGHVAAPAVLRAVRAAAPDRRLQAAVFDRKILTEHHLTYRGVYTEGRAGAAKASALAERLRGLADGVVARHGNVSRWPVAALRADLAIVGLDDEASRSIAQRQLRRAGTPALIVGIADTVAVTALAADPAAACYDCQLPERLPISATPCLPEPRQVSTRAVCTEAARALLATRLPPLCTAVLGGAELSTFHAFEPGRAPLRARIAPSPGCYGEHERWPGAGERHVTTRAFTADRTLRAVFAELPAGVSLRGPSLRTDYFCPECGRADQRGGDLVRRWPDRERCACGSEAVQPLLQLDTIDRREAARLDLLDASLADLGLVPGAELLAARPAATGGDSSAHVVLIARPATASPRPRDRRSCARTRP